MCVSVVHDGFVSRECGPDGQWATRNSSLTWRDNSQCDANNSQQKAQVHTHTHERERPLTASTHCCVIVALCAGEADDGFSPLQSHVHGGLLRQPEQPVPGSDCSSLLQVSKPHQRLIFTFLLADFFSTSSSLTASNLSRALVV